MRFDAIRDGKFIVSDEIQINIEGEILETADVEPALAQLNTDREGRPVA
ncbi:MAG TPA: hypothetical protein VGA47_04255 [Candidatus Dormibacteraeota bacterium]|jgi:hypothetical protein